MTVEVGISVQPPPSNFTEWSFLLQPYVAITQPRGLLLRRFIFGARAVVGGRIILHERAIWLVWLGLSFLHLQKLAVMPPDMIEN